MSETKRFELDEREDDGPERNILGAFRQRDDSKADDAWDKGRKAAGAASQAWSDGVTEAVELANKIITEQIELGKKVANQLNSQVYGFGDSFGAPQDFAESMLKSFTELSTGWFKMMGDMSAIFAGAARSSNGASPRAQEEIARLDTSRDAAIAASVNGLTAVSRLVVSPLASEAGTSPPITGFTIAASPPSITVSVSDDQPRGTYFGAVFDQAQGKVVGWITVAVLDDPVRAQSPTEEPAPSPGKKTTG